MLSSIAYTLVFGKPIIMYGGIFSLLLLLSTATIGFLNFKGYRVISFKWHVRLAVATIIVALAHGLLGLSVFFNF